MTKPALIQLVAWTNSPTQSFEVTKWYDLSMDDPREAISDLLIISRKLYSLVVEKRSAGTPKENMFTAGVSSKVLDISASEARELVKIVHYAWYEGHCLSPEKLSYFVPEKILAETDITVEELRNL